MKNRVNILTIICCIGLLGSCTKGDHENDKPQANGVVTIQLDMPSTIDTKSTDTDTNTDGTDEEKYIGQTQVIFFAPTQDQTGVVEQIINFDAKTSSNGGQFVWNADTKTLSVSGINSSKERGVCVVANATAENGYDPDLIVLGQTTESDLLEAITQSTPLPSDSTKTNGLLMSYMVNKYDFSKQFTLKASLTRQVVKIRLTVSIDPKFIGYFPSILFDADELVNEKFWGIYNIPNQSFVHGATPASAPSTSKLLNFISVKDGITKTGTGNAATWTCTFYTYENPQTGNSIEDKKNSTWFILNLPYKDENNTNYTQNYYKFYINDTNDSNSPHKTVRNHFYDLTATVTGFGKPIPNDGYIHVTTKVLDWNIKDIKTDVNGDYLNVTDIKADTKLVSELGNLNFKSYPLTITGSSSKGGWKAELYIDEQLASTSAAAEAGESKTVELTLPANFKAGAAGTARKIKIKIVDPTVHFMSYKGQVVANVTETIKQYGLGVATTNLGASQSYGHGNFYQLYRNHPFPSTGTIANVIVGPISLKAAQEEEYGTYITTTIYNDAWTTEVIPEIWGELEANKESDPCRSLGASWHVPNNETVNDFILLSLGKETEGGIRGLNFGLEGGAKVFLPASGYREWGFPPVLFFQDEAGLNAEAGGRYWTSTKHTDGMGKQAGYILDFSYFKTGINPPQAVLFGAAACYAFPIRCFSIGR